MDELLLKRDDDGEIHLAGTGAVSLRIIYDSVLGIGEQGVEFMAEIDGQADSRPIMKVAAKVPKVVEDPHGELRAEAEKHAEAWMKLDNVLQPFGFLAAHGETGTPAVLLMEMAMPLDAFLTEAGPGFDRHIHCTKAIARVVFQLLQFIVSADAINFLHRDIKMKNMFVVQSHSLELVGLAVGNFRAAQRGEEGFCLSDVTLRGKRHKLLPAEVVDMSWLYRNPTVELADGNVVYRAGDYIYNNTSTRMATTVYDAMATNGVPRDAVQLDRQLCLYDDLFGWARIAFTALADRPPPDIHSGPTASDYARLPELGYGDVMDAVHHLMFFALNLMTSGRIDDIVNAEYINSLEWYCSLPEILAGDAGGDDLNDTEG